MLGHHRHTLVVSFLSAGGWDPRWGKQTQTNKKNPQKTRRASRVTRGNADDTGKRFPRLDAGDSKW